MGRCRLTSKSYVEDHPAHFMGEMIPTFAMSVDRQLHSPRSMGLEIIRNKIDTFQPKNEKFVLEEQQYVIAKRPDGKPFAQPKPPQSQRAEGNKGCSDQLSVTTPTRRGTFLALGDEDS